MLPHPPQSKRRIIIQQLSIPEPHPLLLLNKEPLFPQQQDNKRRIQIIELLPHPLSLHPQFVAAKSLIGDLLNYILQYRICNGRKEVTNFVLTLKVSKDKLIKCE